MSDTPSVSIISIYLSNISKDVVAFQRSCVERFLAPNWRFTQYFQASAKETRDYQAHGIALDKWIADEKSEVAVILDIDCIPLTYSALPTLIEESRKGKLAGAVQRADHIKNNAHLYVGPFCMAFSTQAYRDVGSPSFEATSRGDIGEELTYRWEDSNRPIRFLWPSAVEQPLWPLDAGRSFGIGTTYEDMFYHSFCIRRQSVQSKFVDRCHKELQRDRSSIGSIAHN